MDDPSHLVNEHTIKQALKSNEFRLYYQPKVDLTTGKITGAEALIRWEHPKYGLMPPGQFIPEAEASGLIIPIGDWVLKTACYQVREWREKGLFPIIMSVNLSVRQFYQPDLIDRVRDVLKETGIDPGCLEMEITESMMMDIDVANKVLRELKAMGVQISLDDFGKGYSSLHYLKNLPIDKIKIDQSFIQNCTQDNNDATLVKTMIVMAHQLNFEVVAEGVEQKGHVAFLQRNLCNEAQGFLFSKPVPAQEFVRKMHIVDRVIEEHGLPSNVTYKKWMEEELQMARQELLETVRKQQGMILKFVKRDGKFIHTLCDGELLYRMGLTPEHVVGREMKEFLPKEVAEEKTAYYEKAWSGSKRVTYEAEVNGIHYISSLRPISRGGEIIEVIGSSVDITERKKTEEALRKSESKYRFIADNITDLIKVINRKGIVEYASPSHEKMLGYTSDGYFGEQIFDFIHPEDSERVYNKFKEMVATKQVQRANYRYKHIDGRWVDVEARGTPVLGQNNEMTHAVIVVRDQGKF
ncbi:EAL domain-containing protein [Halobacillus sp. A1]|uniref:sensor domain-containing phosphodiesterase n=1 Tax=Halobacillus sp. A1 TaxID=2880262 RepID=UPI0020A64F44|nr:EAL domain-containing protein [Halobacillus sp. A1]MCP3031691.1 EAL domain-containing protein [Halobacillus sp. A1]